MKLVFQFNFSIGLHRMDSNQRPSGYGPDTLTSALRCIIFLKYNKQNYF